MKENEQKSLDHLALDRISALSHVQLGAVYRHHKGSHYVPRDVVLRTGDLEPLVTYAVLRKPGVVFCRPLSEWQAKFKKINDPRV